MHVKFEVGWSDVTWCGYNWVWFWRCNQTNDRGIFFKLRHCLCDEHCLKSNSYGWDARVKDRWWSNKFDHANKWGAWFGYKRYWLKKNHRKKI